MNVRDEIRRIPIRRSLIRTQMLLGGERNLVLCSALSSVVMGLSIALGSSFMIGIIVAVVFWSIEIFLLRIMGKADCLMSVIFLRSLKYKAYYPAKGKYIKAG